MASHATVPSPPDETSRDADTRLAPGSRFGRYEIRRLLGEGGFGAVYEAEQREPLRRRVALKVLHDSVSANPQLVARFVREAQSAAGVSHASCATVFDVGIERGVAWLAMEYLEGEGLDRRLEREGALSPSTAVDTLLPVLSAVAAVHDAGIVHRDLKPANIFLARLRSGATRPKLLDFGIAKVLAQGGPSEGDGVSTASGAFLGTPHYASPEQAERSQSVDVRSDQFALGVILYECLTGSRPWPDGPAFRVLYAVATAVVEPVRQRNPSVPPGLDAAVLRALARDPSERFADVRAFGRALLPFAGDPARCEWRDEFGTCEAAPPVEVSLAPQTDRTPPSAASQLSPTLAAPAPFVVLTSPTTPRDAPPGRLRAAWGAVAALAVLVAVIVTASRGGRRPEGPAAPAVSWPAPTAPHDTYEVHVRATPAAAAFELDGRASGVGALFATLPRDGRAHALRVSAPGYVSVVLTFRDASPPETVSLEAVPPPPTAPQLRLPAAVRGRRASPARGRAERDGGGEGEPAPRADAIPNV